MLAGFADSVPAATPVPESGIFTVGFDPSLVMAILPLTLPFDCGAKRTLKVAVCDGFRVKGSVRPLKLKPVPVALACETVRAEPPVLLRVMFWLWVVPV